MTLNVRTVNVILFILNTAVRVSEMSCDGYPVRTNQTKEKLAHAGKRRAES